MGEKGKRARCEKRNKKRKDEEWYLPTQTAYVLLNHACLSTSGIV